MLLLLLLENLINSLLTDLFVLKVGQLLIAQVPEYSEKIFFFF